jgi:hypothetical protein
MKFYHRRWVAACLALLAFKTSAAVLYVDENGTSPTPPYADWSTAATTIQDAVDAANDGDQILVKDGVYGSGSRELNGPNRVAVNKAVTVQSVNGPAVTVIDGAQAMRCVYLADTSSLIGFTLTNGNSGASGGGAYCESTSVVVSNCFFLGNSTSGDGGGSFQGTLDDCTLVGNQVSWESYGSGGGAIGAVLNNCTLTGNVASIFGQGGGAYSSTLNHCVLTANGSYEGGGGAESCVLSHCTLSGNTILFQGGGGGADNSTLDNCTLTGNSSGYGGGVQNCTLNNCALSGNTSGGNGGGAGSSTLNNCTLTGNSAVNGGGADSSTLNNCIVYYNNAPGGSNYSGSTLNFSCTTPLPDNGTNNITAEPQLADTAHISAGSPCIGAGSTNYTTGVDIDGEPWANPPSIGCDEYYSGAITGALSVAIQADYTNVAPGFMVNFTGQISGHVSLNTWDFGDGTVVSNQLYTSHSWASPGDYPVVLTVYNDDNPGGVSAAVTVYVAAGTNYVSLDSTNPVSPYLSWDTAATNIQDAVDAAAIGATVLVSNGVYQAGGRPVSIPDFGPIVTNRVVVMFPLKLQSVNGPAVTFIVGNQVPGTINDYGAVRCVYLAGGATLSGFTITNGATGPGGSDAVWESWGGGLNCPSGNVVMTNCIIINNSAGDSGGGAEGGTFYNCQFIGNETDGVDSGTANNCMFTGNSGCGAGYSTLNNCTVTGNSGVGVIAGVQNNCIVYFNSAGNYQDGYYVPCMFNYSCTTPLPDNGTNNITADPQLADFSHITAGSPCRSAGSTNYSTGVDIDHEAWASPPSMGCDEFHPGNITGPVTVAIQVSYTNVARGFIVNFTGQISGHASSNTWDFGDGTGASNQPYTSHDWAAFGNYPVILRAYNESNPGGVSATQMVHVLEAIHYVVPANASPVSPFISWATAATNIQDAVDAAFPGGTILVTNGVYGNSGRVVYGTLTNRVVINRLTTVTVESVNGPAVTVIQGYQDPVTTNGDDAVRCVFLGNGSQLVGFTLNGGATRNDGDGGTEQAGGGLWCDSTSVVASNCVLTGNSAAWAGGGASGGTLNNCTFIGNSASYGGGVYQNTLNNCTFSNNSAAYYGGAAYNSALTNCVLSGNFASGVGGGICYGTANNCILAGNFTGDSGGAAYGAVLNNCVLMANSANNAGGGTEQGTLNNCTLTGNSAANDGGGADSSVLNNCKLTGNLAGGFNAPASTIKRSKQPGPVPLFVISNFGGGAENSTLNNCTLIGNAAGGGGGADSSALNNCIITGNNADFGGGAENSTLNNCTVAGNSAYNNFGGAEDSTLNNCIVYYNTNGGDYDNSTLNYCCTAQLPDNGTGNITNEPAFVDLAGDDFHLQPNSPCINAGNNSFVTLTNDLDGNPRIQGGTVDIGAYEYQTPTSVISYAWLQQYGLTNDGSADYADTDGDGMNNYQEWVAGTDPTDASSVLKMLTPASTNNPSGLVVSWQSVNTRTYYLQRSTDLGAQPAFSTIQTDIAGQAGTTSYTDTDATGNGPYFYRVGVQQ